MATSAVNSVPRKREKDDNLDTVDQKSYEDNLSLPDCTVSVDNCLQQLITFEVELNRLEQVHLIATNELELEKDLKKVRKKYYNEITECGNKTQSLNQTMKKKNDLKKDIYDIIDKMIGGIKSHIDACKEIKPLVATINDTLIDDKEKQESHFRECVTFLAEFANRAVEIHVDSSSEIGKIDTSPQRDVNDIVRDYLETCKLIKLKGPLDPFAEKIAVISVAKKEIVHHYEDIATKNEEAKLEEAQIDAEMVIFKVQIQREKEEIDQEKKKAILEEEADKEKLVKLIYSNMEKQNKYVEMGHKIEEMQGELGQMPQCQQKLCELKSESQELEEKLSTLKALIDETREAINNKKSKIENLKKNGETMEKDHAKELQEIQNETSEMEIKLHSTQKKLQQQIEIRDKLRIENNGKQQRLAAIEDEYRKAKDEVRQRKTEKKKNLKEKRKIKEKLDRELVILNYELGIV